jgi:putative membrane protein
MLVALAALGASCWLAGVSWADDQKERRDSGDKEFVTKAARAGLAEVNLGNLAARHTRNPQVGEFARQMITDHTQANRELIALANRKGIALPEKMDENHQKLWDKLAKMDGAEFDHAFMEGMVKDHEEAVQLFETESKDGKDEALKGWAGRTLPVLKKHLDMARDIAKKEKGEKAKEASKR